MPGGPMGDLSSAGLVLLGALVSTAGGYVGERVKWRRSYSTRWDEKKLSLCADFLARTNASITLISDVANARARGSESDAASSFASFQEERAALRGLLAQIRMIAPRVWPIADQIYDQVRTLRALAERSAGTEDDFWRGARQETIDSRSRFTARVHAELDPR